VAKLIARQVARGETPFLHVMRDNAAAHKLYVGMGFRDYRETVVRVVSRTHDASTVQVPPNANRKTTCSS
jgi:ribosomal protein S18 acetylase RimI-like enzyme